MDSPISKFDGWWQKALADSPLQEKSAVCVSTINEHGFPTGRFVDLKSVSERGFVFCTNLDSAKSKHIVRNPKAAMTIWWDHVGYQVRVVGTAEAISTVEADGFWQARSRRAQLTTTAFDQSEPLDSEGGLAMRLEEVAAEFDGQSISRPDTWSGYCIDPFSIEFLTFRESRLHLRELYERSRNGWIKQLLQP